MATSPTGSIVQPLSTNCTYTRFLIFDVSVCAELNQLTLPRYCRGESTGAGDTSETCGGFNAISVYAHEGAGPTPTPPTPTPPTPTPPTPTPPTPAVVGDASYVGCFVDSQSDRLMPTLAASASGMTSEVRELRGRRVLVTVWRVH